MINEKAILILEHIKELHDMDPELITEEDVKALDRAIQALKTEPFLISEVYSAQATIKELLNRIYGMQAKEKRCINCQYYRNHYGYGQCFGQKNAPRVEAEINKAYGNGYQEGHKDGYDKGYDDAKTKYERATAKWIFDKKLYNWKCSRCDKTPKTIGYVGNKYFMQDHFKFCNHCGASIIEVINND